MDAFGNMGSFCGKAKVPYWSDTDAPPQLPPCPADLSQQFREDLFRQRDLGDEVCQRAIRRLVAGTSLEGLADDFAGLTQFRHRGV